MTPSRPQKAISLVLLAFLAGWMPEVEAQDAASRPSFSVFAGFTKGRADALIGGLELRTPAWGRLSGAASGSAWLSISGGCDLSVGPACSNEGAKALDIGPVIRLTPAERSWRLEATGRLGGIWFSDLERGIWDLNVGLGLGVRVFRGTTGLLDFRYHALTGRGRSVPHPSDTRDHFAFSVGLQVGL